MMRYFRGQLSLNHFYFQHVPSHLCVTSLNWTRNRRKKAAVALREGMYLGSKNPSLGREKTTEKARLNWKWGERDRCGLPRDWRGPEFRSCSAGSIKVWKGPSHNQSWFSGVSGSQLIRNPLASRFSFGSVLSSSAAWAWSCNPRRGRVTHWLEKVVRLVELSIDRIRIKS
jgi:hypothetical protein